MLRDEMITVFGGSGFVGRYVVRALVKKGYRVRVATRRPHIALDLKVTGVVGQVELMQANVRDAASVRRAVEGAHGVVNLVGILAESGSQQFASLQAKGAQNIAEAAAEAGAERFVQISAIGADPDSLSRYAQTKAQGEEAVSTAFAGAVILRPSIVFGAEDEFFNRFAGMARFAPALPLPGGGKMKMQPVFVGDVADCVANAIDDRSAAGIYELGGPRVYTYRELMEFILETIDRPRFLVPVPMFAMSALGFAGELAGAFPFVEPFLTRDQVILLGEDNVVSPDMRGIADLGVTPETVESIVPSYLERYRRYGQFHESA
ncbi:complex I NDUFA9 subunit family protein [Hyphobacterium sp.]|jgi:NADH dehydrogenase|uniref:complex I NDUFA9 subunit family protein n=1 Tax=Hyphobacterium sp. TaxID=2004662 RepID=UPI003BAC1A8E